VSAQPPLRPVPCAGEAVRQQGGRLTAPALLAHAFLAAGPSPDAGWSHLQSLWHSITRRLRLDQPIPSLAVAADLPLDCAVPGAGIGLLAAAERRTAEVWQACAWADHGLLCLSVMMAPPRDTPCGRAWTELEEAWEKVTAGSAAGVVLGEARVFLSLLSAPHGDPRPGAGVSGQALSLVRAATPAPAADGWWQHWDTVQLGLSGDQPGEALIWEIGPDTGDDRRVRRLAALAPASAERELDHFLWTRGDGQPTSLTRHLGHAARLRYQVRVYDGGRASRSIRDELSSLIADLSGGAGHWPEPIQYLVDRDWFSVRLQRLHAELITLRVRLSGMRQAVDVIGENMRMALELPQTRAAVGPLSEDRALAASFGRQLDDGVVLVDAAIEAARSARPLVSGDGQVPVLPLPPTEPLLPTEMAGRRNGQGRGRAAPPGRRAVIVTALPVEYQAVREYLDGPLTDHDERGTVYEVGTLAGVRGGWHVAAAVTGPGSTNAGLVLDRVISSFDPEVAIFVGVAGGRKDVRRGDVVVADAVYDYESGKSSLDEYQPRMRTHLPAHHTLQRAFLVAGENQWQRRIRPGSPGPLPAALVKPIVTGGKVVAHDRSEVARLIDRYASDAVAIEMEGYGFLAGAHLNPGMGALVIRGISDLLTGKDPAADEYWQPIASRNAAAFAVELLDRLGARPSVTPHLRAATDQ